MKHVFIAAALILGISGSSSPCLAQARVITGDCMGFLTDWFQNGGSLEDKELENLLFRFKVTALWLPWPQNSPPFKLTVCLRDKTQPDERMTTRKGSLIFFIISLKRSCLSLRRAPPLPRKKTWRRFQV